MNKVLVIAPHADDEVLGCGATISKVVKEGSEVFVLICTYASVGAPELYRPEIIKQVRSEALEAHRLLCVKETFFLEFPAPMLDQYPRYKISNDVAAIIKKIGADTVFIPHRGDCHKDHTIIHECAMVACRPLANCPVKRVYAYETLSETEWGEPVAADYFVPTKYMTFTAGLFAVKREAMSRFKSQLYAFPASRSLEAIEALAKYRGCAVSAERAEAFEVLREID